MKFTTLKIALVLLAAALLASCATATIKETWRNPAAPATPYHKLLVVGIANDENIRRMFENIMVETLRKQGMAAVQSHTLLDSLEKADRTLLQETAHRAGADGVLITRGTRTEQTNYNYSTGQVEARVAVSEKSTPDSSSTMVMSAIGVAARETDFELATLQTNVFDAASAKLVWSAQSKVRETGRRADACWELSVLLVKALRTDRMIEGRSE